MIENFIGKEVNGWVPLYPCGKHLTYTTYMCECACGSGIKKELVGTWLKHKEHYSRCLECHRKNRKIQLFHKYGKLTTMSEAFKGDYCYFYYCWCECGEFTIRSDKELSANKCASCGCVSKERKSAKMMGARRGKKYTFNEDFFNSIDTEEKAYWLGFIVADGCVHKDKNNNYRLSIGLHDKDITHLHKFIVSLSGDNGLKDYIKSIGIESKAGVRKCRSVFRYRISTNLAKTAIKHFYKDATIFLDRKMQIARKIIDV